LLEIVDRVESVKEEHEKLEGGNRFLQSCVFPRRVSCVGADAKRRYIGELMQTSKLTAAGAAGKGGRSKAGR
jgi:short coiled-coil protein